MATIERSGSFIEFGVPGVRLSGIHTKVDEDESLDFSENQDSFGLALFVLENSHDQRPEIANTDSIEAINPLSFLSRNEWFEVGIERIEPMNGRLLQASYKISDFCRPELGRGLSRGECGFLAFPSAVFTQIAPFGPVSTTSDGPYLVPEIDFADLDKLGIQVSEEFDILLELRAENTSE